jgi:hypothetical protein
MPGNNGFRGVLSPSSLTSAVWSATQESVAVALHDGARPNAWAQNGTVASAIARVIEIMQKKYRRVLLCRQLVRRVPNNRSGLRCPLIPD